MGGKGRGLELTCGSRKENTYGLLKGERKSSTAKKFSFNPNKGVGIGFKQQLRRGESETHHGGRSVRGGIAFHMEKCDCRKGMMSSGLRGKKRHRNYNQKKTLMEDPYKTTRNPEGSRDKDQIEQLSR